MTDRRTLPVLLLAVLSTFTAQQVLTPVLAPLAREIGLSEVALGSIVTVAAIVFASTALAWGRAVDRFGRRAVLITGMALGLAGMAGFAVVAQLAVDRVIGPDAAYVLMLATRSVLFGAGVGAVPVAAIALAAATTPAANPPTAPGGDDGGAARTSAIGRIGAVQGLSLVLGPALGGLLAAAGLLGPGWVAPAVLAAMLVAVVALLPRDPARAATTAGPRPRALRPWDARLWPVLAGGFCLYLALALLQIVVGFLVQDRLRIDAAATVAATGAVFVVCGIVLILVQGVLVPRLRWPATRLLRTGAPIALLATLALLPATALWSIAGGMALLAVGLGIAFPGFTTAPTLLVGPDEQGGVAGLVQTITGVTFVIGPVGGTALYGIAPEAPIVAAAGACLLATALVLAHPALRSSAAAVPAPAADPAL
jgi:MFS family permease